MSVALLDINDCNLRLWHDGSAQDSPGYALLEGDSYRFGREARGSARLRPRDINNRYWLQLGTAPLQPALGPARHTADLVHAHLQQLHAQAGAPAELLLACPGSMQREQLSLLLGIAQQCPFRVVGLVDRAVLLGSAQRADYHLEMQLHQSLLTELVRSGDQVSQARSIALPGCGMLQVQERLVEIAADAFIRQTRFDPRRHARTEQALYDALPAALAALAERPEYNFEVEGYRARLTRAELKPASERLLNALLENLGNTAQLLADPLLALLPGMAETFPDARILDSDAAWRTSLAQAAQLVVKDGPLSFISALPDLAATETADAGIIPAAPTAQARSAPTHLLSGATARPLGAGPVTLAGQATLLKNGEDWVLQGDATVNGEPAGSGRQLQAGDIVEIQDREFRLIEVADD